MTILFVQSLAVIETEAKLHYEKVRQSANKLDFMSNYHSRICYSSSGYGNMIKEVVIDGDEVLFIMLENIPLPKFEPRFPLNFQVSHCNCKFISLYRISLFFDMISLEGKAIIEVILGRALKMQKTGLIQQKCIVEIYLALLSDLRVILKVVW